MLQRYVDPEEEKKNDGSSKELKLADEKPKGKRFTDPDDTRGTVTEGDPTLDS